MTSAATVKTVARRTVSRVASLRTERQLPPGRWGLSTGNDGRLRLGDLALADLTGLHGSPLHIVDLDRLDDHVGRQMRAAGTGSVAATHHLVAVGPILRHLHDQGLLGVVASIDELDRAAAIGIDPGSVVYAEAAPTTASLARALDHGVRAVTVASVDQVALLAAVAAQRGAAAPSVPAMLELSVGEGGPIGSIEAGSAASTAAARDLAAASGVDLRAIRLRRSAPVGDAESMLAAAAMVADGAELVREHGVDEVMLSIDVVPTTTPPIAGARGRLNRFAGVDLPTPRPERGADPARLTAIASATLRDATGERTRLIVEPGRALTASTQFMLATVLDVKDDGEPVHVVLDAGINLAEQTQTEYHQLFNVSCAAGPPAGPFRLVGPICTPADVLYTNWRMPRAEIGDVLAIMDTGAGFVGLSTSFSFPRPAVVGVRGSDTATLRRGETFDDLVELDLIEPGGAASG